MGLIFSRSGLNNMIAFCCGKLVDGTWRLDIPLGKGAYGAVYKAFDRSGTAVAIKFEHKDAPAMSLYLEAKAYSLLRGSDDEITGIPTIHKFGIHRGMRYLTMDQLGCSVRDIFNNSVRNTSRTGLFLPIVLNLAFQAITRLEYIHCKGLIHRDIKPDNLMYGLQDPDRVYLVDFGLSKPYIDARNNRHIPLVKTRRVIGSMNYMSQHAHRGYELSRRDDLESLGYTFISLFKGSLPWSRVQGKDEDDISFQVFRLKRSISLHELCEGMPFEVLKYFRYIRGLEFMEKPNYTKLRHWMLVALRSVSNRRNK